MAMGLNEAKGTQNSAWQLVNKRALSSFIANPETLTMPSLLPPVTLNQMLGRVPGAQSQFSIPQAKNLLENHILQ